MNGLTSKTTNTAKLVFHGELKKFGDFECRHSSTAVMLRNAFIMRPGLRQAIMQGEYLVYRDTIISGRELTVEELQLRVAIGQTIHIIPAASGSKGRGAAIGKTILGVAIAVAAVVTAPVTGGGSIALGATAFMGISYGAIAVFGVMTMLAGVASLLGGKAKVGTTNSSSNKDSSTTLSGTVNSTEQGGVIPLIYGRKVRVGSTVASLSYSAQEWSLTDNSDDNPSGPLTTADTGAGTGSKGKGGSGSGGGSREAPNNVRSKAVVSIIDIIGQGPGVKPYTGLDENGAKSIYFNGTPLMADDGTYNFEGVKWAWRTGEEDQDPIPGFPAAESTISVGTKVLQQQPVIQSVQSDTATSCRVVLQFPALYQTDTSSGVLNPIDKLEYKIEIRVAGQTDWTTAASDILENKKCISPYEKEYVFQLPGAMGGTNQWDIRVTRITADNDSATVQNDINFQYVDMITDHQIMYSGVAYCALVIDSSVFGDSVPDRTYDVTGKDVKVPANYDVDARTYATTGEGTNAGSWDGVTYKQAANCDDPAWCLLDVLQGDFGFAVPDDQLGSIEYDLFEASQYGCGQVPDGFGNTEARYALNVCITQSGDAYSVLGQFASAFRGMTYYANGGIAVSADMPREPVMIVTNANVTDGNFSYEGTADSGRHNVAYVKYTRLEGATAINDIETYTDFPNVAALGVKSIQVDAFGETRRGGALRCGHWYIDTELYQTQTVTYECGIDHAAVRPGEIIQIADQFYQGARKGGRVRAGATTTVVPLDSVFVPTDGLTYSLKALADDGSILYANISSFANKTDESGKEYTEVTVDTALASAPSVNTIWAITEPTTETLPQWRVVSVLEKSSGKFQITALFHDPAKFDRVEYNLAFNEKQYSDLPNLLPTPLPPPTNVTVQNYTTGEGVTTAITVAVGYTSPKDGRVLGFSVRAINNDTGETTYYDAGTSVLYEIPNMPKAHYTFGVRSYGKNGSVSVWADTSSVEIDGNPIPAPVPAGLVVKGATRKEYLSWNAVNIRNLMHYEVHRASDDNNVPGAFAFLAYVDATTYTDDDAEVLMPETKMWYRVRAIDTYNIPGAWSDSVYGVTTYLLTDDLEEELRNTASIAKQLQQSIGTPLAVEGDDLPPVTGYPDGQVLSFTKTGTTSATLYKLVGGQWSQMVSGLTVGSDGKLTPDIVPPVDVESIDAAKITGQLTSDQIADLDAAKVSGTLPDSVVSEINIAKTQGQITQTQITDGSVSTSKVAANAITTNKIASGAVTADQVAANAITVAKLAANSVTAQKLAAGAVTTEKLAVGSTSNLIANSCGDIDGAALTDWWAATQGNSSIVCNVMTVSSPTTTGQIWNKAYLNGFGSVAAGVENLTTGVSAGFQFQTGAPIVPITPGATYIFSIYANGYVWNISLNCCWCDANKNWIATSDDGVGDSVANNIGGDGTSLDHYKRIWKRATAPANAQYAYISIESVANVTMDASSAYIVLTKAQICEVPANSTEPPVWSAGGVTTIDGSLIKTGTLNAAKVVAGSITGDKLSGGTITGDKIAGNTISGTQLLANTIGTRELIANVITAAQIAAGAIGTDQLAARAITAEKLAVTELIVDSAQIGNLVVGTSKIQDSAVTVFGSSFVNDRSTTVTISANASFSGILSWGASWASISGSTSVTVTILQTAGGGTQGTLAIEKFVTDGSISGSCPFISNSNSASFSIGVSVSGNANVTAVKLCVMGRMK